MQLTNYAFDENLALNGKKVDLGDGSSITIARWGNKNFTKLFTDSVKPYGKHVDRLDASVQEGIYFDVVAKTIVLGWEGIFDGKEAVPYSTENVARVFRKYPEFAQEVIAMSKEFALFRSEAMEADLGNSAPS
jgi:hypothetical protein